MTAAPGASPDATRTRTSVGIDVGTTTTQVVVSELAVATSGLGAVSVEVADAAVVHRGPVHETPTVDPRTLDASAISALVEADLADAGYPPSAVDSGAVVVTGESSSTDNAARVVERLAVDAGSFVVAAAGPELESVLAGTGSGAAAMAADGRRTILNVDVGGGTTNMCLFAGDDVVETRCLTVGGRAIRFDDEGAVTRLSDAAEWVRADAGFDVGVGARPAVDELRAFASALAEPIFDAIRGRGDAVPAPLALGSRNYDGRPVDGVVVSGGVGRLLSGDAVTADASPFAYDDLGVLLAAALRDRLDRSSLAVDRPTEDIRATVVGAGTRTTSFSGATTHLDRSHLPVRDLPVVEAPPVGPDRGDEPLVERLRPCFERASDLYDEDAEAPFALSLPSITPLGYDRLTALARAVSRLYDQYYAAEQKRVVVTRQNCGKALGQRLDAVSEASAPTVVVDEVAASEGQYLDVGDDVVTGTAVPVVVKTLVFGT